MPSWLWDRAYKRTLAANRKVARVAAAGFFSHYPSGPLPYAQRHITVNKNVLSASLNKTFERAPRLFINVCFSSCVCVYTFLAQRTCIFAYLFEVLACK